MTCIRICHRWNEIVSGILYEELYIDSLDKFRQAYMMFGNNSDLGKVVHELKFEDCKLDLFSNMSLPGTFPNIKRFIWLEGYEDESSSDEEIPYLGDGIKCADNLIGSQVLQRWQKLELFKEDCCQFQVVNLILETTNFSQLGKLEVDLGPAAFLLDDTSKVRERVLKNLKNVPGLRILTL